MLESGKRDTDRYGSLVRWLGVVGWAIWLFGYRWSDKSGIYKVVVV